MQISIDASTATPIALRLTAAILTFIAAYKENPHTANLPLPTDLTPPTPETPVKPVVPVGPVIPPPPPSGEQLPPAGGSQNGTDDPTLLLDSANVAWDPEHHTANQSKNADGTWRRKRSVKGEAAPRTVELPQTPQVPPPPPITPVEPVVQSPALSTPAVDSAAVTPVVPPAPPVSTGVPPEHGVVTFAQLVKFATNHIGKKHLSTAQLLEACAECGVPDIHACNKPENVEVIPRVATAIQKRVKE